MRKLVFMAAAAGAVALGSAAQALPLPQQPAVATVQTVAQGCGWGYHRGQWGGCRPNGVVVAPAPVVVAPRPVVVAPRTCWWRHGPYGAVRVCN